MKRSDGTPEKEIPPPIVPTLSLGDGQMMPELEANVNGTQWRRWTELTKQQQRERLDEIREFLADLAWCRAVEQEFEAQLLDEANSVRAAAEQRLDRLAC